MPLKIRKNKSPLFIILLLILTLLTGLTAGYFSRSWDHGKRKIRSFFQESFSK